MNEHVKFKTKERNVEADCKEFGRRLQVAMDRAGLSQADLARIMGVSRSAANWWTQGNTYPSIANAKKIADLLRTTPEYLLFGAVKVAKERLVDSIAVVDRGADGKQSLITRISIPREFMTRHSMPDTTHLRAVTMFTENPMVGVTLGDIVIADTSDKALSVKTAKPMVLDNGERVSVGMVTRKRGDLSTVHVQMDGTEFDMPFREGLVIGKMVAAIVATHTV